MCLISHLALAVALVAVLDLILLASKILVTGLCHGSSDAALLFGCIHRLLLKRRKWNEDEEPAAHCFSVWKSDRITAGEAKSGSLDERVSTILEDRRIIFSMILDTTFSTRDRKLTLLYPIQHHSL
jgi:hypothetical protein